MSFNKVVYIRYLPLTEAIYTDLYFEELLNRKIQVEYLDVTALFNKIDTTNSFSFTGIIKINKYAQLDDYLKKNSTENVLYISIMTFEWSIFKLYRRFTKFNLKLGVFARGVFPSYTIDKKSKFKKISSALEFSKVRNYFANRIALLAKKTGWIKPYDIIFKAGEFGYWGLGLGSEIDIKFASVIEVNTVDYDRYLTNQDIANTIDEDYIVFLDQYLPYHPDVSFLKIKTVEPIKYYKELNIFFEKLETSTHKKVIISAHPKADIYKKLNPFNNRKIYFNQSNELVKKSSLVLTHASTAVCFPICYQKKIVLITNNYINEVLPQFEQVAKAIKVACDATIINMDENEPLKIPATINEARYNDFKYKYLTSTISEHKLSKDIFIEFLKSFGATNSIKNSA